MSLSTSAALVTATTTLAAVALNETMTISGFGYRGNNPEPQIFFTLAVDSSNTVGCAVVDYDVPGMGYPCDDVDFTFDVLSSTGSELRLHHVVNG
ncbi:hypothetical protein PFICI_00566 [Pestalotiopsis fici W106-1]|uniref:AA1-like domain-containing protein n=1 Tax=Pestalotiopsis fici (strain W106-1 / CGMCC3.15140) TaxID=1229662 RepID=W3XL24_PESFW|nr:uncharacterized protein PFICI_00566 [Pestalotiopsis fici W106-1]ETS86738.1 hypothetical protein PFICI_00566 [Pestalotiopsis fici W106-1]